MTVRKHQITKNPTTGAQPKTTLAGAIVEKLEAWMLTQQISVDEITKFNALIDSLKGSNRLQIVICFIDYLKSATKFRSIWIQQIAGLMKAVSPASAKRVLQKPLFDVTQDVFGWLTDQHFKDQPRLDARIDKWTQQLPLLLAAIRTANAEYISKGLSDFPADFHRFLTQLHEKGMTVSLPASLNLLNISIKSGECTIAALGVPTQQMMAWPLKAEDFSKELVVKEAKKYLWVKFGLDISDRTLSNRANEFPNIRVGNKYDRDGLNDVASAGHFHHKNLQNKKM